MLHRTSPLPTALALLLPLACAGAGCSTSSGAPVAPVDAGPAQVTCQKDTRVDTYVSNFTKASASGKLKVSLTTSDPAPPAVGTNSWTLRVTDGAGAPITNAPITIASFMPDHGHGSSVRAVITPGSDGTYTVAPVYLFMPGVWRVTFALPGGDAGAGAGAPEEVAFFFCIAG